MSQDRDTIRVYDERAAEYASVTAQHVNSPFLQAFTAALPPAARVLDLGCGPGLFAAEMARAGLRVDASDASAEMVALAARHRDVSVSLATFDELSATDTYDGIWANFSLLHARRADLPRHLAAIHRALRPGGQFHLALKTGTGEGRDLLGRFYTYYTPEELTALLHDAGFTVTKITPGRDKGLDGTESDWVSVATHA